jgi:glucan-binding YG repeat protein
MKFLKKLWNWLLGQTTVDEKIEAKVTKVKKEIAEVKTAVDIVVKESKDVATAIKPKKKRNYSKPKGSGFSPKLVGSGASPKLVGSGASPKLAGKK